LKQGAPLSNSVTAPTHCGIEFAFANSRQFEQYLAGDSTLGRYGRYDNETWRDVERELAMLEGADEALLFASGMSAILTCALSFVRRKTKVLLSAKCYRNTAVLFQTYFADRMDVELIPIDPISAQSLEEVFSALHPDEISLIFVESPSNPHMYLFDIQRLRDNAGPSVPIVVDATLSSPVNFRPTKCGADVSLHSCTKYISGHGDVMGGVVTGRAEIIDVLRQTRNIGGAILDPRAAAVVRRSLETLPMRMTYVQQSALEIALWLDQNPRCERVYYTGLGSHPHHDLAERCLTGHGGLISFELTGDAAGTRDVIDRLKVPKLASNFGSSRSLIEQCSFFTYHKLSNDERKKLGISDTLIRLSVGFEPVQEIIGDLAAAIG
jgi:cystathionine gamma-synthase